MIIELFGFARLWPKLEEKIHAIAIVDVSRAGRVLQVVMPGSGQMTYLWEGRVCLWSRDWKKNVETNYKINLPKTVFKYFPRLFKRTFHWLLQVYCITQKNTYFWICQQNSSWKISFLKMKEILWNIIAACNVFKLAAFPHVFFSTLFHNIF